jgi:hypothetical protein
MPMFNNLPIKVAAVNGNRMGGNAGAVRNITEKNNGDDFFWDDNNNDKKNQQKNNDTKNNNCNQQNNIQLFNNTPQTVLIPAPNQQNIQPCNQKDDDFDWGW